jgi:DNA-binding NarL/FixJ family response regulator
MTRVVIVDDHEALREGLAALLAARGIDVLATAGNAAAAADLVEHAEADVAVVDLDLPDTSGIELARALAARGRRPAVLLYAAAADGDVVAEGLHAGARGYALKQGSADELVEAIERVAAGATYVDPRLDGLAASSRTVPAEQALTAREREVVRLMAEGRTAETIAGELSVSTETVRTHVRNVIRKLRARNRVHAVAIALERREIALDGEPRGGSRR